MRPYHADMTRLRWSAYLVTAAAIAVDLLCWVWTLNWLGDEWAMYLAIGTLLVAPVIVLGVLVATRRPDNPVGLMLTLAGSVTARKTSAPPPRTGWTSNGNAAFPCPPPCYSSITTTA